ncbi:MAG: FCD domain-containing protein [Hyphomicrobiales bacterium]|nr:FCD domain-containing protein [Hyphomicrobiales bacterium]
MGSSKTGARLTVLRSLLDRVAPQVGDRLPPERELARQLGCSRETLRQALLHLEDEGELWRHVGKGTFRGKRPAAAPLNGTLRIEATSVKEFIRARMLIEPVIAGEAAQHATPADIQKLRACVQQGRNGGDRFECQLADDLFHRTIAEVAKNSILFAVLTFLSEARRRSAWQSQWDRTYRHFGIEEFKSGHSDQHDQIVDEIENRNTAMAGEAMSRHLETVVAALQLTPGSPHFSQGSY